jgi:dTDP-4-amino-4,6-dideoxygalactose transaminase
MRDEFLVFGSPLIGEAEIAEVVDSLRSGWIGTGPKVARFERMLEEYVGVPHARCVSSCTAALFLAMKCLGVGPGDEVLVPALTFVATANAVEHTGARPVLIDSVPGTGLMDLDAAEAAITPRTRAILPVHLYGRPVDMDRLNSLRDKHELAVVEDAAHALGARWRDQQIGSFGNLSAYSFYPTKNITTIEGGALVTNDLDIAIRVEQLALHGLSAGAWQRFSDTGFKHYGATEVGYKFNMTDVQAALGLHQLPHLDEWIQIRANQAARYDTMLADLPFETPPATESNATHAHHLYPVLVSPEAGIERDVLLDRLTKLKIGVGVHYRAIHLHPYYAQRYDLAPAALPVASDMSERTLSLPMSPKVTEQDMNDMVEALTLALRG